MPPPASVVPSNIPTLHLYRHLLREITYLPPAFSGIISDHVTHRFHQHAKQQTHVKKRLARARSGLRNIKAANHGDKKQMAALISKGFGRSGWRRYELVSHFVEAPGPNDSSSLEALLETSKGAPNDKGPASHGDGIPGNSDAKHASNSRSHAFLDKWDKPKLAQFLRSQRTVEEQTGKWVSWDSRPIRSVDENSQVPEKNTWGKPPSEILVRAKQAKWWKRHADKMMPPLGKGEWDLLQRLSNGAQDEGEWEIPTRRTPAKLLSGDADQMEPVWDWEDYATNPTAWIERPRMAIANRYLGESNSSPFAGKPHRNTVPGRWFRRTYGQTWQKTAHMEQDPNTLKYKFTWGALKRKLPSATERQRIVFEGVDDKGRELRETSANPAKP